MSEKNISNAAIGWAAFAGILLLMVGIFQAFAGLVAIIDDTFYAVTPKYVVQFDSTQWGWIHLILGIIVALCGLGIFSGNVLARTVGVFLALGSAITMFAWLPYYPVWAIIVIAISITVIWALTAHGRDIVAE